MATYSSINTHSGIQGNGFKTHKEGQSVMFDIVQDMKEPKAVNVQLR